LEGQSQKTEERYLNKHQAEVEACVQLKQRGLKRSEIADRLGLTTRQVKSRLEGISQAIYSGVTVTTAEISGGPITAEKVGLEDEYFSGSTELDIFSFEKDQRLFRQEELDDRRDDIRKILEAKLAGRPVKVLYIADLHIPFTDYKKVQDIIEEHSDADLLVINGDFLDLFAVSKFAKDKEVALRREIEEGREFLEFVSGRFKDIVITEGNHERRLRSFIKNIIPADMQFLFPDDILKMIVDGTVLKEKPIKNIHVVGSWWFKLFDTIYAHPDNYSTVTLRTVQNTSEFFLLVKNEWHRMCVVGHTHRAGWVLSGGVKLMETGCLCHDMDYHSGSKFVKTKWTKAYAVIHYDEHGAADLNRSVVTTV
jgi:predicted phosphodiesterase